MEVYTVNLFVILLAVVGLLAILMAAFFCGAVYEDLQTHKAYKEGKPHKLGTEVVRIIPWEDAQGQQ